MLLSPWRHSLLTNYFGIGLAKRLEPITQITDGQIQVPGEALGAAAAPVRAETAEAAPPAQIMEQIPEAGMLSVPAPMEAVSGEPGRLTQIMDGQIQNLAAPIETVERFTAPATYAAPVSYAAPGQTIRASAKATVSIPAEFNTLAQIPDGQVQNIVSSFTPSTVCVKEAECAPHIKLAKVEGAAIPAPVVPAPAPERLSQIPDGQIQNIEGAAVPAPAPQMLSQLPEGQVLNPAPEMLSQPLQGQVQKMAGPMVGQIADGQIIVPARRVRRQAPGNPSAGSKPLTVYLENGVLRDSQGRQGYIADNYQFQFDAPPQITPYAVSGFAACSDGNLSLNGSPVFYQCRSGDCRFPKALLGVSDANEL